MAEGLLRHRLAALSEFVTVGSAGTVAVGQPASPYAVSVLSERGVDVSDHRSRRLVEGLVEQADLVIGMTREHVREACVLVPDAWQRSFTLKELVRRAGATQPRPSDQTLSDWLVQAGSGRLRVDLLGEDPMDDVADPIGLPEVHYRATAAELDDLILQLVGVAWPRAIAGAA
jgi:protein-tyrosine phosphatase